MAQEKGRITGLGGIFLKCKDTEKLMAWYRDVLGIACSDYGAIFPYKDEGDAVGDAYNVWGPFKAETDYFKPSDKDFMINLRVDDLDAFLARIRAKGVETIGDLEDHAEGRFAWVIDPEGTKIELWQQKPTITKQV